MVYKLHTAYMSTSPQVYTTGAEKTTTAAGNTTTTKTAAATPLLKSSF